MPPLGINFEGINYAWNLIPIEIMLPEHEKALRGEPRSKDEIHVSTLTICPYASARKQLENFYWPFDDAWRMLHGIALDALVSRFPRIDKVDYQYELRQKIGGIHIIGTPDLIDFNLCTIEDFKRPKQVVREINDGYKLQINAYYWMIQGYWKDIDWQLYLNFCGPRTFQRMQVERWPFKFIEERLEEQLNIYLMLMDNKVIASCGDEACFYCRRK